MSTAAAGFQTRAVDVDSAGTVTCECGCGQAFPATQCIVRPTGSVHHPYEVLSKHHADEVWPQSISYALTSSGVWMMLVML